MDVPHDAGGARIARKRFASELRDLIPPALLADAVAVVAELLGNAVRHAAPLPGGVIRVSCRAGVTAPPRSSSNGAEPAPDGAVAGEDGTGAWVQLRVTDGGSTRVPVERPADPDAIDGRGLAIVAALAHAWGVDRDGEAQSVWAELGAASAGA